MSAETILRFRRTSGELLTAGRIPTDGRLVYEARAGEERLVVALSVGGRAAEVPAKGVDRVLAGVAEVPGGRVRLPGHGRAVVEG